MRPMARASSVRPMARAEPLMHQSLEITEKTLRPDHPQLAKVLNNLGVLYESIGAYEKAEPMYLRSLEIQRKILDPEHPDTYLVLGLLYEAEGDIERATSTYRAFLDRWKGDPAD